jgi:hypothetical protein
MRVLHVCVVFAAFTSIAAIATAHVVDDATTPSPAAVLSQPTPAARRPVRMKHVSDVRKETESGHVHVTMPPLVFAPVDRTDPWTGRVLSAERTYYAPLDTTDPWSGRSIALSTHASVDATDPWK